MRTQKTKITVNFTSIIEYKFSLIDEKIDGNLCFKNSNAARRFLVSYARNRLCELVGAGSWLVAAGIAGENFGNLVGGHTVHEF